VNRSTASGIEPTPVFGISNISRFLLADFFCTLIQFECKLNPQHRETEGTGLLRVGLSSFLCATWEDAGSTLT
jgi:hypothetical protein